MFSDSEFLMSSSCHETPAGPLLRVAVIGAGIAGAMCARRLADAGARVTLHDKARGPGGRMSTRRHGDGAEARHLDHGATGFESHSLDLLPWLRQGAAQGWLQRWDAVRPEGTEPSRWVAVPGMNELVRRLLHGLPLQAGRAVVALHRDDAGWQLQLDGEAAPGPQRHDAVVLAMPPRQAAALLVPHQPDWAMQALQARMQPCWTLMAETDEPPAWDFSLARPAHGPLELLVRDDLKPGRLRRPGRALWVAQARADWSGAHVDLPAEAVAARLLDALRAEVNPGGDLRPHFATAHRWLYARPEPLLCAGPACWWEAGQGLGVCGDFLGGGTVELAALSGLDLAERIGREPPRPAQERPPRAEAWRQEQPA
ncbi:MAG: hypothetical protein RLZZ592_1322 [Pseudomonadota bacterium]|jgi:predicted NAD/FAD-dependent oxidoreductase